MPVSAFIKVTGISLQRTAVFILALLATGAVYAQDLHKMIVPFSPIGGGTVPFWIAVEEKLFQKFGLEVTPLFVGGSSAIVQSMAAKQFDIGLIGGGGVVLNRFAGGDLITIGAHGGVMTADGFAKPEIKSLADIKGKQVAITRFGTTTHFAALMMLRLAGLRPNDAILIQTGGNTEALAALLGKQVDCALLGYPTNQLALQAGFKQITRLGRSEYGLFPNVAIGTRESWLKSAKNREQAINFLRAFSEGLTIAKKDAAASKKVMRKYARVNDDGILQASFEFYKEQFPPNLRVDERSYANLLRYLDHPKAKSADPKEFFDNSLIDEISH
jgi:NitT/TauT family transport system substrate-binding protein